jgi:hypothetical protein
MEAFVLAVFSGLLVPLVRTVITRHYDANPNAWEGVFLNLAAGVLMICGGGGVFKLLGGNESLFVLPIGILAGWAIVAGLAFVWIGASDALDLVRETRGKST